MEWITRPEVPNLALEIEKENQRRFGPCSCCGEMTSRVWGYAYRAGECLAAYFVEWTPGYHEREATFDLVMGHWGEETVPSDRKALSLGFRHLQTGPSFMIQNASVRSVGSSSIIGEALDRDEVLGTPLADQAFAVCDLIYLGDPRIEELRTSRTSA